jgi:subtilase family serine protease
MRSSSLFRAVVALLAGVAAVVAVATAPASAGAATRPNLNLRTVIAPFACRHAPSTRVASCFGEMLANRTDGGVLSPHTTTAATGYGPADIQSAYKLAGSSASGRTVAIVDAYHDPKAAQDLATYRSHYGLPACTTANGCFTQVNQNGATSPAPTTDYGWALEESLDLDMVSAACPSCHILLVEANSANNADLYKAVDTAAATPGVVAISNSYGAGE